MNTTFIENVFLKTMSCSASMSKHGIAAYARGKATAEPKLEQIRVLMPLPPVLGLIDDLVSERLNLFIDGVFSVSSKTWLHEGARPSTQAMDIAHAISLTIEKGLDMHSACAVSTCDIQAYYDTVPVIRVASFLESRGVPAGLCAAAVRHQLLPPVAISIGDFAADVDGRTSGSITGSRIAGALARVPVLATLESLDTFLKARGIVLNEGSTLCIMTYVDNIFALGKDLRQSIEMCTKFEEVLAEQWGLVIKPDSRECLQPRGASQTPPVGWSLREHLKVLGHVISYDGSCKACIENVEAAITSAFWAQLGHIASDKMSDTRRLAVINRCCRGILTYRAARWTTTKTLIDGIDGLQRRLVCWALRDRPAPGDDVQAFMMKKARRAKTLAEQHGTWSRLVRQKQVQWRDHLLRHPDLWAAKLFKHHINQEKLLHMRSTRQGTSTAGRTATRIRGLGHVHRRWHDCVDDAMAFLNS